VGALFEVSTMKLKATIEVEFEGDPNAPENALRAALTRGVTALRTGIQHGLAGAGPTNIKHGSVKAEVTRAELDIED